MQNAAFDIAPVLAVTGMAHEARLAAGPGVIAVRAGCATNPLRSAPGERRGPRCRAILSFGIAGGLDPSLLPGDVVLATAVIAGDSRWPTHPVVTRSLADALARGPLRVVLADLVSVDEPLLDPLAKRAMHAATGAVAADMESHQAAAYAAEQDMPLAALRIICDPAGRAVPPLAAAALMPNGEVDIAAVIRTVLRQPSQLAPLSRLAGDAAAAFRVLRTCRDLLGFGLGVPYLGQPVGDMT